MTEFKVVVHLPGIKVTSLVRSESQHNLQLRYKEALNSSNEMLMIEDTEGTKFFPMSKIILFEIFEPVQEVLRRA